MNQQGVEHYDDVIASMVANGIKPAVTLFHWGNLRCPKSCFNMLIVVQIHLSPYSIHMEPGQMNEL